MTWLSDEKGCGKCNHCAMDMDMAPFCTSAPVLAQSAQNGTAAPFGLNLNPARLICKGDLFTQRVEVQP
jgi:hypothetical protein